MARLLIERRERAEPERRLTAEALSGWGSRRSCWRDDDPVRTAGCRLVVPPYIGKHK